MPTLTMLKGLPASGKSTWAKEYVLKHNNTIRVNKDNLRSMLHNSVYSKINERQVLRARNAIVIDALLAGHNVIVDDTNFQKFHEETLQYIAKIYNADFKIMVFDTPLDVCLERNAIRQNAVPDYVIKELFQQFVEIPPKPLEVLGVPEIIICDLDGTLAISQGRDMYHPTADEVYTDILNDKVAKQLVNKRVVLMSGRFEKYRSITEAWLKNHGVIYDALYMRADDDTRKDYVVKKELYTKHILGKYNVDLVYDDRDQVVRLWRDLGLTCFQVAPGNF